LIPHKFFEHCKDYDYVNKKCIECDEGFLLDSFFGSPFCAWDQREADGVTVVESSVPMWSK
jgi:hypothetical protein